MKGIIMNKKEKLLQEIRKLSLENSDVDSDFTYLEDCGLKALFNYTSLKNLKKLKKYILWDIDNNKKFVEE
jgi:hypothetical protein